MSIDNVTRPLNLAQIASELGLKVDQVANVVALLDEGNTVPFITRYRKERTGNLDEEKIRQIEARANLLRQIAEKAETILRLIEAQGKLTPELRQQIEAADSIKRLEDLYLPYRPKRQSRAEKARQQGLEPLAQAIRSATRRLDLNAAAASYVSEEKGVANVEAALQGASDIIAETVSEDVVVRDQCRKLAWRTGKLVVSEGKAEGDVRKDFENYFNYEEPVWKIPPHRVLALNRGEHASALKVKFDSDTELSTRMVGNHLQTTQHPHGDFLQTALEDAVTRLIQPSIEREIRRELTDQAELHGIQVFAKNLRSLLLQPPVPQKRVLAIDPGFRTGCKIAVLDECGQCLLSDVVYVTGSNEKRTGTLQKLAALIAEHGVNLIAVGNGTACRETEELVSELIQTQCPECRYLIVNEAGASIYSASTVAREEFPDLDATARGTISIGRRLQDPLSELVKIEPQHIGVGMYQHDMTPKLLKESLDGVVESCVNFVGVDLNSASASLLRYVSGMNQLIARRVVEWRDKNGRFTTRRQLLDVPGIGEATFTQAAGFLKIANGEEPLDATWIHPESYDAARRLLSKLGLQPQDLLNPDRDLEAVRKQLSEIQAEQLTPELQVGVHTLKDIIDALSRPGRDPRVDYPGPVFKQGILKLEDLAPGMELKGTILNVVDFGAFVDIGLKDSGLVHISQLASRYIKNPHEVVSVGDIVTVWVQSVDLDRRRVSLTMINPVSVEKSAKQASPAASGNATPRAGKKSSRPKPSR